MYKLPSQPARDFRDQKDTFTFKGSIGFDNGFGDKFTQSFCVSWLGYYRVPPVEEHEGMESGGGAFVPCEGFKDEVAFLKAHQDPKF